MKIIQRTDAWFDIRRGKPTASEMWRLMGSDRVVETYKKAKMHERLIGELPNRVDPNNPDILRGIALEDEAIRAYEIETGYFTEPGHWVDKIWWGCTPDAFVEDDGLVQIKCPRHKNAINTIFYGDSDWRVTKKEYYWQAMAEIAATDREWNDFGIYCKEIEGRENWLWIKRIWRDENAVANLLKSIEEFCSDLDERCRVAQQQVDPLDPDDIGRYLGA